MNAKDTVSKGYDCFSKGDMETFFNEVIHDDCCVDSSWCTRQTSIIRSA